MRDYSCSYCLSQKLQATRDCYMMPWGKKEHKFSVPRLDDRHQIIKDADGNKSEMRSVDLDGFLEILESLEKYFPDKSSYEIHQLFFKEVCLTATIDEVAFSLIEAESTVSEYKGAIGSLGDEDLRYDLLGFGISYSDLLSAFRIIRSANNGYDNYNLEKMQNENKSQSTESNSNIKYS